MTKVETHPPTEGFNRGLKKTVLKLTEIIEGSKVYTIRSEQNGNWTLAGKEVVRDKTRSPFTNESLVIDRPSPQITIT